jgi:poly-gamma-glutamate capsule biosynthesis protein CapA/YwtB (metallophosphatase superfamily)
MKSGATPGGPSVSRDSVSGRRAPWAVLAAVIAVVSMAGAAFLWEAERPDEPSIAGRVVGPAGQPVANASVRTPDGRLARTTSGGRFHLDGDPAWVTVTADGWISRSRVVAPGETNLVRLARRLPGTVTFAFGGDVMFGRRYFDARQDGSMQGLLEPDDGPAAHERLLAGVAPMLADADLTAVNLESPIVEDPAYDPTRRRPESFHPTKEFAFASAPAAAAALRSAGVDVVDLGNNHLYDRLQSGVQETRRHLASAGLGPGHGSFGAGVNAQQAWAPALREANGQRVAFLGCTSADVAAAPTTVATATKGGAARCRLDRLRRAVEDASRRADIVVVMVHGGQNYGRTPSARSRALTDAAVAAGATMVINQHPHVAGGLRYADGKLTAWTMGNLLFDQTVWPTFESYLLKVAVHRGRVVSAWLEPVRIQDYQPTGLYGADADWVARGALARSVGPWVAEAGSVWLDNRTAAPGTTAEAPAGQLTRLRSGCAAGAGRELLWTGDFESRDVHPDGPAPLWNVTEGDPYRYLDGDAAHDSPSGVLLHRADANIDDVVLNPQHRIPVRPGDRLTLLVDHRALFGAPHASVQLSWYNDSIGQSQQQTTARLPDSSGWTTSRIDVTAPEHTVAVLPIIRLRPPNEGVSQLAVDNVRLIDWDQRGCDYLRAGGTIRQSTLPPRTREVPGVAVTAGLLPVTAPPALPAAPLERRGD